MTAHGKHPVLDCIKHLCVCVCLGNKYTWRMEVSKRKKSTVAPKYLKFYVLVACSTLFFSSMRALFDEFHFEFFFVAYYRCG